MFLRVLCGRQHVLIFRGLRILLMGSETRCVYRGVPPWPLADPEVVTRLGVGLLDEVLGVSISTEGCLYVLLFLGSFHRVGAQSLGFLKQLVGYSQFMGNGVIN